MSFSPPKKIAAESESLDQYPREISEYPLMTATERHGWPATSRGDPGAAGDVVRSNLFVVAVAQEVPETGSVMADLSRGEHGRSGGAEFARQRGSRISYAVWWIRQAILQALAEQSSIVG